MASIPLSKGKTTILDDDDFMSIIGRSWHFCGGYARTTVMDKESQSFRTKAIYLHRFLMGLSEDDPRHIDHINGDRLDNRKENLRVCEPFQNSMNALASIKSKTGVRGVCFDRQREKWVASLAVKGKKIWKKRFSSFDQAVAAREAEEIAVYGEYRRT